MERLEDRLLLSWTVLVYLDGDNNLDGAGVFNVNQMESVAASSDVNVVVEFDRASGKPWAGTRRAKIVHDTNLTKMTSFTGSNYENPGEQNMGDWNTLESFIQWGVSKCPADHYLLDLWDHGGGLDGVCWDDTSGSHLTLSSVRQALTGVGTHIDVVGFDACLMGMEETAHELGALADVMVASEELVPGDGWPYDTWLTDLVNNPNMTAAQVATSLVDRYGQKYGSTETLSAVNLANEAALASSLDVFAQSEISYADWATVNSARDTTRSYGGTDYLDLGTFLQYVENNSPFPTLCTAAGNAYAAYQSAVIANYSGSAEGGTGMSIYMPSQGSALRSDYTGANFHFVNDTHWQTFLTAFTTDAGPTCFRAASSTPGAGSAVASAPVDYTISLDDAYDPNSVQPSDLTVNSIAADSVTQVDAATLRFHYNTAPTPTTGNYIMAIAAGAIARQSNGEAVAAWSTSFRYGVPHISVSPSALMALAGLDSTVTATLDISNSGNWNLAWSSSINPPLYVSNDSDHTGGPAYSWIDVSTTGTAITGLGDETNVGPYDIGFTFPFYDQDFSSFRVCSNGYLSFTDMSSSYSTTGLPSVDAPRNMIALAWNDMDLSQGGSVYYQQIDSQTLVVEFLNAPVYWDNTKLLTAEVILSSNGTIKMQYRQVDITDGTTVGIQDAAGTAGLDVCHGNSTYLHADLAVELDRWLTLWPASGTTASGSVTHATATFNSTGLAAGIYATNLAIHSDDPDQSTLQVPVALKVGDQPPAVSSVASTVPDGTYAAGAVIPILVTFTEPVIVTGTPTLTLDLGDVDRVVSYTGGSGTTTLAFNYTVQCGDASHDLDYPGTTALALNGGSIRDAWLFDALLTLAAPGAAGSLGYNKNLVIDTIPAVADTSPSYAGGALTVGTASFDVTFNETVVGADAPASYSLRGLGSDGLLGTADDTVVPLSVAPAGTTVALSFAGLAEGVYRLVVRDTITDTLGRPLDGDGDGNPGGVWFRDFVVTSRDPMDPSFGTGGEVVTNLGARQDTGRSVLVQPDGKIVVAGYAIRGGDSFALARYNANGTLDTSFGAGGKVTTNFSGEDWAYAAALQSDGKIVVVGTTKTWLGNGWRNDFAVARYNTDGNLDASFDGDGRVITSFESTHNAFAYGVAMQGDKIVVAGYVNTGTDKNDFALVRYNADGSPDLTFDGDGKVVTDFGSHNNDFAYGVVVQGDKIVVAGYAYNGSDDDFAVARYNADGSPDTTFNGTGRLTLDFNLKSMDDRAYSLAIQGEKIVVAGYARGAGKLDDFALTRYNADGSLDTTFGTDGKTYTGFRSSNDRVNSLAFQSDGKIVVAGYAYNGYGDSTKDDFALARYDANGNKDTTFGIDGKLATDFGDATDDDYAYGVAIQDNGMILVAGNTFQGTGCEFAVARYLSDGSNLDTTFGTGG